MKARYIIFLIFIVLAALLTYPALKIFFNFSKQAPQTKTVFIPKNSSLTKAANILQKEGVIESAARFKILVSLKGLAQKIKPGEYEFTVPDHPINILGVITKGKVKRYKVTIPEGYSIKEIAVLLSKKGLVDRIKFYKLAKNQKLKESLNIKSPTLEGYLFPETYMLEKTMTEIDIIKTMVRRFFKEVTADIAKKGENYGFDLHKIITFASMIEKETGLGTERPLISSVFHNRLKKNMRLQCDPTVIYGIKKFDGNLTKKHLQTYTPYNTYKIKGLPLGPIANPGLDSIKAVIDPKESPYLYFVAKKDGSHIFSKNYREHLRNVRKYQLRR